jgi:hypothetical protein
MRDPNMDTEDQATPAPPSPAATSTDLPAQAGPATVEADGPPTGGEAVAPATSTPATSTPAASTPAAGEAGHEAAAVGTGEDAGTGEDVGTGEDRTAEVPAARAPADDMGVPGDVPAPAAEPTGSDVQVDEAVVASGGLGAGEESSTGTAAREEPADAAATTDEPGTAETDEADAGVAAVTDEPVARTGDDTAAEEDAGGPAEDVDAEPVGSQVAVAEPVATATPQPRGVWSEEQAEAFRARLREVTATAVDRAAGAVIETVNSIAAAVRSRTSSDRRREPRD